MYNLIISGNITRDSESRTTPSGKPVINFTLAVNYGTKDQPHTEFVECSVWGKRAESDKLAKALTKGTKMIVTGQPRLRAYVPEGGEAKAVEAKAVLGLFVDSLEFCGGGNGGGNGHSTAAPAAEADADIPF